MTKFGVTLRLNGIAGLDICKAIQVWQDVYYGGNGGSHSSNNDLVGIYEDTLHCVLILVFFFVCCRML